MFAECAFRELMQAYGRAATAEEMEAVSQRLALMTEEQTVLLTREWRQNHPHQVPEFQDLLDIQRRSAMTADETLTAQYRDELLMVSGVEADVEFEEATSPDTRPLSQRWLEDLDFVEGGQQSLTLADSLWSHRTPRWVAIAASLLEVWTIEGQRLPDSLEDERAREVEQLVDAWQAAQDVLLRSLK